MPDTPEGKERIAKLETELPHVEEELESLRKAVKDLQDWQRRCALQAAKFGGGFIVITTLGAWLIAYFEAVKRFLSEHH